MEGLYYPSESITDSLVVEGMLGVSQKQESNITRRFLTWTSSLRQETILKDKQCFVMLCLLEEANN